MSSPNYGQSMIACGAIADVHAHVTLAHPIGAGFLLYRVIKMGKDDRFDGTRDKFLKFLGFWVFQVSGKLASRGDDVTWHHERKEGLSL